MKKKFDILKTVQLVIFLTITAVGLFVIFSNSELYQKVGREPGVVTLCILLWLALGLSFIFIFLDFRSYSGFKREYRELDYAVYNDYVAGIANRYSCDAVIEKYFDQPLPDTLGCIMLDLANIGEINRLHGHAQGNAAIQAFSDILNTASVGVCFVGRNGGNKFMALFEECDEDKLNAFLSRVAHKTAVYNSVSDVPHLEYRYGRAFQEGDTVQSITQLIALADRRITNQTDAVAGVPSRSSCDDIISQYLDRALPPEIGCIMLDLTNIQAINEAKGYREGNRAIRRFADILRVASSGLCFVGRNGGTRFLALFEKCDEEKLHVFLSTVHDAVTGSNNESGAPTIQYSWGTAFHEGESVTTINKLIALANQRVHDNISH